MTAAGPDGRRQPAQGGTDQDQDGAGRRLLQDLQQRVGGILVQVLGAIDDRHAPAAFGRGQGHEPVDLAHVGDGDIAFQAFGFVVVGPLDGQHIGVPAGHDPAEHRMRRDRAPASPARAPRPLPWFGPASKRRAKRNARVALPIPSGPVISQA